MTDLPDDLVTTRPFSADRPLAGQTMLLVEDSRFACEALRLLALRSGARIRRADSLRSARRHLQIYRPSILIVDLGLPDGPGEQLIRELARMTPRIPVILGTSGEPGADLLARLAGADGFLPKPVESLALFQHILLTHLGRDHPGRLPADAPAPAQQRDRADDGITPDTMALRDDLAHADAVLAAEGPDPGRHAYAAQFVRGLALAAQDQALAAAAAAPEETASAEAIARSVERLRKALRERLDAAPRL